MVFIVFLIFTLKLVSVTAVYESRGDWSGELSDELIDGIDKLLLKLDEFFSNKDVDREEYQTILKPLVDRTDYEEQVLKDAFNKFIDKNNIQRDDELENILAHLFSFIVDEQHKKKSEHEQVLSEANSLPEQLMSDQESSSFSQHLLELQNLLVGDDFVPYVENDEKRNLPFELDSLISKKNIDGKKYQVILEQLITNSGFEKNNLEERIKGLISDSSFETAKLEEILSKLFDILNRENEKIETAQDSSILEPGDKSPDQISDQQPLSSVKNAQMEIKGTTDNKLPATLESLSQDNSLESKQLSILTNVHQNQLKTQNELSFEVGSGKISLITEPNHIGENNTNLSKLNAMQSENTSSQISDLEKEQKALQARSLPKENSAHSDQINSAQLSLSSVAITQPLAKAIIQDSTISQPIIKSLELKTKLEPATKMPDHEKKQQLSLQVKSLSPEKITHQTQINTGQEFSSYNPDSSFQPPLDEKTTLSIVDDHEQQLSPRFESSILDKVFDEEKPQRDNFNSQNSQVKSLSPRLDNIFQNTSLITNDKSLKKKAEIVRQKVKGELQHLKPKSKGKTFKKHQNKKKEGELVEKHNHIADDPNINHSEVLISSNPIVDLEKSSSDDDHLKTKKQARVSYNPNKPLPFRAPNGSNQKLVDKKETQDVKDKPQKPIESKDPLNVLGKHQIDESQNRIILTFTGTRSNY